MKMNFSDLGIENKLVQFSNGKDAVDYFRKLLDPTDDKQSSILPVSLLLLDINMPIVDGLECAKSIKELYREKNLQSTNQ